MPLVDIFVNPSKKERRRTIIEEQQNKAENFFTSSNMSMLYPNLFKLLWYASLPLTQNLLEVFQKTLQRSEFLLVILQSFQLWKKMGFFFSLGMSITFLSQARSTQLLELKNSIRQTDNVISLMKGILISMKSTPSRTADLNVVSS